MGGFINNSLEASISKAMLISLISAFDQPALLVSMKDKRIVWTSEAFSVKFGCVPEERGKLPGQPQGCPRGYSLCVFDPDKLLSSEQDILRIQAEGDIPAYTSTIKRINCIDGNYALITVMIDKESFPSSRPALMYTSIFLSGSLPMLLIDPETGSIIEANPPATRLLGKEYSAIVGSPLNKLVSMSYLKSAIDIASAMRGEDKHLEGIIGDLSESPHRAEFYASPCTWNGRELLQLILLEAREEWGAALSNKEADSKEENEHQNILIDNKGEIIHTSRSFAAFLGKDSFSMLGMSLKDLCPQRWREIIDGHMKNLFRNGLATFGLPVISEGDTIRWFELYCIQVDDSSFLCVASRIARKSLDSSKMQLETTLLEQLFDNYPMAIMLAEPDSTVIRINRACTEMFGYEKEEFIGLRADDLIVPESRMEHALGISEKSRLGGILSFEDVRKRKDGSIIDVSFIGLPVTYYGKEIAFFAIYQDISDRKISERQLTATSQFIKSLFEVVTDGIFYKDIQGRFQLVNRAFAQRRSYPPDKLIGLTNYDILPRDIADRLYDLDKRLMNGVEHIVTEEIIPGSQGERIYEINLSSVAKEDGDITGIIGVSHDITIRKRNEGAVREVNEKLVAKVSQLEKAWGQTISVLALATETRDLYTAGHQRRVAQLAREIGIELGLDQEAIRGMELACTVHDIGKIDIPIEILTKPTRLNEVEFDLIKTHSEIGWRILKNIECPWPLAEIVYQHHERSDGSGYPRALTEDQILLEARILSVADIVEAMAYNRPYRPALGLEEALAEITRSSGRRLDRNVVNACLDIFARGTFSFTEHNPDY